MLLFLTREAFLRFSMEERLGERQGDGSRSYSFSDPKRPLGDVVWSFQKRRGLLSNGDEPKGDVSLVNIIICATLDAAGAGMWVGHTLVDWLKLGEFLLRSVLPISESGRDRVLPFAGEAFGVLFIRSGDTFERNIDSQLELPSHGTGYTMETYRFVF
jgi:hypothetical protein